MALQKPTKDHLEAVQTWLTAEKEQHGASFINNWDIIREAFDGGRMLVETELDEAISFFTWSAGRRVTEGLVAATAPAWRGRGVGARMLNAVHPYLYKTGVWAVHVECFPEPSEKFWRRQGYLDYPAGHQKR